LVLALMHAYPRAVEELRAAVRLAPRLAQAHVDLADVLATMGRIDEAAREYRLAIQTTVDPDIRAAALEGLRSLPR
jgi:Flp pilus assembly protein TadD